MGLRDWYARRKLTAKVEEWQDRVEVERKRLETSKEEGMSNWLHTVLVIFGGGALSALADALSNGFTADAAGLKRAGVAAIVGGLIALVAWLKQSPIQKPAAVALLLCLFAGTAGAETLAPVPWLLLRSMAWLGTLALLALVCAWATELFKLRKRGRRALAFGLGVIAAALLMSGCDGTLPADPTTEVSPAPAQKIVALAFTVRQDGSITETVSRDSYFTVEAGPRCALADLPCPRVSRVRWSVSGAFCETLGDITGPSIGVICTGGGVTQVDAVDLDSGATGTGRIQVRF